MSFKIGPHTIDHFALLAPMAGVTDFAAREIARSQGAGLCYSEMLTADIQHWNSRKSSSRLPNSNDPAPRPIQIAGSDPHQIALAAKVCQKLGAGIVDINLGCPAKKVCSKAAGSALMADETLLFQILEAVVEAVSIPVTIKTRLGPDPTNQNVLTIAKRAESLGIQAITVHGRTRACKFRGTARYELIGEVANAVDIPIIANGDIDSPEKAEKVIRDTGASAVMIGRASWGRPWLLGQIDQFMQTGTYSTPTLNSKLDCILRHLILLNQQVGEYMAVRLSRKQVINYIHNIANDHDLDRSLATKFLQQFNRLDSKQSQYESIIQFFAILGASNIQFEPTKILSYKIPHAA